MPPPRPWSPVFSPPPFVGVMPLAEVLRMAIRQGPNGPAGDLPERSSVIDHSREQLDRRALAGAGLTAAGLALSAAGARAAFRGRW